MDRNGSVELWGKCQKKKNELIEAGMNYGDAHNEARKIWNGWAEKLIAERNELKQNGLWKVKNKIRKKYKVEGLNKETQNWLNKARIDFEGILFLRADSDNSIKPQVQKEVKTSEVVSSGKGIDFCGYKFPGVAHFNLAIFDGWVWFMGAEFNGPATFRDAQFLSWAGFEGVVFKQNATFKEVTFQDHGAFTNAIFKKDANFRLAEFKLGNFREAVFEGDADFFAINSQRGFLVEKAKFEIVPNFVQACFPETPNVKPESIVNSSKKNINDHEHGVSVRYGALKRLASQALDHNAELHFFVEELRAIPCDKETWPKKIAGHVFAILSNYGRSMLLPVFWWLLNGFGFWWIYQERALSVSSSVCNCNWDPDLFYNASAYIALINNIPFSQFFKVSKLENALNCLGASLEVSWPGLSILLLVQSIISVFLVFLFLLALRNYFRIR